MREMGRQFNIRSDRAYALASELSALQGRTLAAVVEDALAIYRQTIDAPSERVKRWKAMLREDRKHLTDSTFEIEDLYDPETGLPA